MSYIGNPIVSTDFPVDYKSGNGSTTAFTLSIAPASVNSIDVQISGVSQSPQTYSVSGNTLTFSAAPPTGTNNIVVRHLGIAGIPNTPTDASVTQTKLAANVAGTGPAFSAYENVGQTITSGVFTKVTVNTEVFDTNNNYDPTTNYRFTPTVAGYYQVTAQASTTGLVTRIIPTIYKNGAAFTYGNDISATGGTAYRATVTGLIYMDGSTDYLEFYVLLIGTGTIGLTPSGVADNYFQGVLVRAA